MRSPENRWCAAILTGACLSSCILANDFRRGAPASAGGASGSSSTSGELRTGGAGRPSHDAGGNQAAGVGATLKGGAVGAGGERTSTLGSSSSAIGPGGTSAVGGNSAETSSVAGGSNAGGASIGGSSFVGASGGPLGVAGTTGKVEIGDCVLLLHLDEANWNGTIGEVKDASGLGNHGTAQPGASIGTLAKFSRAGSFDGSGYVAIGDNATLRPSGALTLSAWIYPTNFPDGGPGIISKRRGYSDDAAFTLFIWTENRLYADIDTENDRFSSSFQFATNAWYHVVLVFDGSLALADRARFYINGSLDSVHVEQSSVITDFDSPLEIGRIPGGGAAFQGAIDEVAIWRRALTPSEIAALYYATGPISP